MIELEITDPTTDATLDAVSIERVRDLDEQARATVAVYRDDWRDIEDSFDEINAEFTAREDGVATFSGRFGDSEVRGVTARVEILSYEEDAKDAEPTGANVQYQNVNDSTIATDAINAVGTLSPGTVETLAPALSYSVSHGSRSKVLRDLRQATGGELRYNADKTVDYVDRLGTDRSGDVTISPDEQTLGSEVAVVRDTREEVTHVRVLGGQSGPDQVLADAVASSYSGGRKVYRRHTNKEIIDQGRAQKTADTLVNEYDGEPRSIQVTAAVYDADLDLGDTVTVAHPDAGLDPRSLRVVSLRTVRDSSGARQEATLSNRELTRQSNDRAKEVDDIQTFNRGFQGFIDRDQATSGWDVAGDGTPQTLLIPAYPDDIVDENRVELTVEGRAWRAPLDILSHDHAFEVTHPAHDHGVNTTSENNASPTDNSFLNDDSGNDTLSVGSTTTLYSFTPSFDTFFVWVTVGIKSLETGDTDFLVDLSVPGNNINTSRGGTTAKQGHSVTTLIAPNITSGTTIDVEVFPSNLDVDPGDISWRVEWGAMGRHTHDVSDTTEIELGTTENTTSSATTPADARVVTSFGGQTFYPTDVDIEVDGQTVTTLSGNSGQDWTETVDLSGELSSGSNTISATPTSGRGELRLTLATELFRRGPEVN